MRSPGAQQNRSATAATILCCCVGFRASRLTAALTFECATCRWLSRRRSTLSPTTGQTWRAWCWQARLTSRPSWPAPTCSTSGSRPSCCSLWTSPTVRLPVLHHRLWFAGPASWAHLGHAHVGTIISMGPMPELAHDLVKTTGKSPSSGQAVVLRKRWCRCRRRERLQPGHRALSNRSGQREVRAGEMPCDALVTRQACSRHLTALMPLCADAEIRLQRATANANASGGCPFTITNEVSTL